MDWPVPDRPKMLLVVFKMQGGQACFSTEQDAKNFLINIERLKSHITILEDQITRMERVLKGEGG